MKVLLDENVPRKLKFRLADYAVYTVRDKEWNGKKNGELLKLMLADNFDVLLTVDKNLAHQQNSNKYPVSVLVIDTHDNSYSSLMEFLPQIKQKLNSTLPLGLTLITK
jgi:predicted nuclease of predicted toxin-antitoxin system